MHVLSRITLPRGKAVLGSLPQDDDSAKLCVVPPGPAFSARASYEPRSPCYDLRKQSAKWRPRRDGGWSVRSDGRHPSMHQLRPDTSASQRHIDKATGRAAVLAKSVDATSSELGGLVTRICFVRYRCFALTPAPCPVPLPLSVFPPHCCRASPPVYICRQVHAPPSHHRRMEGPEVHALPPPRTWSRPNQRSVVTQQKPSMVL